MPNSQVYSGWASASISAPIRDRPASPAPRATSARVTGGSAGAGGSTSMRTLCRIYSGDEPISDAGQRAGGKHRHGPDLEAEHRDHREGGEVKRRQVDAGDN